MYLRQADLARYLNLFAQIHLFITFVDLQLDAQNSDLFTYNTFINILYAG
jgi:hypothetical protein